MLRLTAQGGTTKRVTRVAAAAALAALTFAASAEAAELSGEDGVVDVQRKMMSATATCAGSRQDCQGRLSASASAGQLTKPRFVRLRPGMRTRVTLQLRADGLARLGRSTRESQSFVLRQGRRALATEAFFRPADGCGRYRGKLASAEVKTFSLQGFGHFACQRPAGRLLALGFVEHVRVAGRFVAFSSSSSSNEGTGRSIRVVDVARRRATVEQVTRPIPSVPETISTAPVTDLLLRRSGAVAWIENPSDGTPLSVRAIDPNGLRELDRGIDIAPGSLETLGPSAVSWRRNDTRRTAGLS